MKCFNHSHADAAARDSVTDVQLALKSRFVFLAFCPTTDPSQRRCMGGLLIAAAVFLTATWFLGTLKDSHGQTIGLGSHVGTALGIHLLGLEVSDPALAKISGRLRAPAHDGHDSGVMADSIPAAWRTVFRSHAGQFGPISGMVSGMPGTLSAISPESCPSSAGARNSRAKIQLRGLHMPE